jgi:hypothetical protein
MGASARVLFSDAHVTLTLDDHAGLVRYVRSRERFPSMDAIRRVHEQIVSAIPSGSQQRLKLLVDVRDAPPRNDEAFEAAISQAFADFLPRFAVHAVLIKSAAGRLQVQRLRGGPTGVFEAETDALRYLGIPPR